MYYWIVAVPVTVVAVVFPAPTTVAAAVFVSSAAVHSVVDWFGAGPEPRPWADPSDRAVYLHPAKRWLVPKRWIRYDGAPEDVVLAGVLSIPGLVAFDGTVRALVVAGLVVGVGYAVVRKRLPDYVNI